MSFKNVNQAEQVARNEMDVATARVLNQMGFSHGTRLSVDLLSDIAVRYMRKMCSTVRSVTDHCGRTSSSLGDVEYAYHKLSVDVDEMNEFMRQNLPIPARPVPRFPAPMPKKESKVAHIAPQKERPEHFPSWAPPIYTTGVTTIASNSHTPKTREIDVFPDFSACSAISLGLNKNREKPFHLSRPASSASFFHPLSRTGSRNEHHLVDKQPGSVDSRPGSSCSNASGAPMFKRRKRKLEQTVGGPSTSARTQSALQPLPEQRLLITAKDLAMDHRPIMNAVHSGRAAPPVAPLEHPKVSNAALAASVATTSAAASAAVTVPSSTSQPAARTTRFFHENLQKGWDPKNLAEMDWKPGAVAPVKVMQYAIMRHILVYGAELPEELQKAFEFIHTEPEPVRPPTPPPAAPEVAPTPFYRIVPVEPVQEANAPAGALPPLKIRITKNSLSCEPSPATLNGTPSTPRSPSSPQAKRHKHKKKKKHKKKRRRESEECQIVEAPKEGGGGGLRLKIRFGGAPEASSAAGGDVPSGAP